MQVEYSDCMFPIRLKCNKGCPVKLLDGIPESASVPQCGTAEMEGGTFKEPFLQFGSLAGGTYRYK